MWEGFVRCCQRTKPQSFQVLLQLQPPELKSAFEICPDMKEPLVVHVSKMTPAQVMFYIVKLFFLSFILCLIVIEHKPLIARHSVILSLNVAQAILNIEYETIFCMWVVRWFPSGFLLASYQTGLAQNE